MSWLKIGTDMIDWDDIRIFLAVADAGSVRSASQILGVKHSTILRRIAQLEARLGAHMFERLPSGYRLTRAGEDVLDLAQQMQNASNQFESRVSGRDEGIRGLLRVALPPPLATHLLMPDLVDFAQAHPDIELNVLTGDDPVNLTNRQADVAIRVVFDRDHLPLNLHGFKGPELFGSVYMARERLDAWRAGATDPIRWILRNRDGVSEWARQVDMPTTDTPFVVNDGAAQLLAVRLGLGMAALSCFVADADPALVRVPGATLRLFGTLWILTQGETRKTRRVREFTEFMTRRLASHAALLSGKAAR